VTPSTEAGHQAGEGRDQQPRVEIYVATVREHNQVISCALVCPQIHEWIYIEQIDPPMPVADRPSWARELRKIPRAQFAKGETELLETARATVATFTRLAARSADSVPHAVLRTGPNERPADVLGGAFATEPAVVCRKEADEFWLKCGGKDSSRQHALLVALELAASDSARTHAVMVEDIARLELLLGTKNAQSMRAWLRQQAAIGKGKEPRAPRRTQPAAAAAT